MQQVATVKAAAAVPDKPDIEVWYQNEGVLGDRDWGFRFQNSLFYPLRGYCTPGQFLDCFCNFLKTYNILVTSKICFL